MTPSSSKRLVERGGAVDGVLSGHPVDHQIHLVGLHLLVDQTQLIHQLLIDRQAAGGIQNDDGDVFLASFGDGVAANLNRILGARLGVHGHIQLLADDVQLFDGGRSLQVGRDKHGLRLALHQRSRQLAAGGGLAGALQAAQHQNVQVLPQVQRGIHRPQDGDQLLLDNPNQLLAGIQGQQDLLAQGLFGDRGHEVPHDIDADIGLQQGLLHQRQTIAHIGFGQLALAAQALKSRVQTVFQRVEHRGAVPTIQSKLHAEKLAL